MWGHSSTHYVANSSLQWNKLFRFRHFLSQFAICLTYIFTYTWSIAITSINTFVYGWHNTYPCAQGVCIFRYNILGTQRTYVNLLCSSNRWPLCFSMNIQRYDEQKCVFVQNTNAFKVPNEFVCGFVFKFINYTLIRTSTHT